MQNRYIDLIKQTFDFPQPEFSVKNQSLKFHGIDLMPIIEEHGTPLKISYLPSIEAKISEARKLFANAIKKHDYNGNYRFCYCTKSSHFEFVINEVLSAQAQLELSAEFDFKIIEKLEETGKINQDIEVICNGHKAKGYVNAISSAIQRGFTNIIPVLDSTEEYEVYENLDEHFSIGIRVAVDEEPTYEFYTSRLGINPSEVMNFYREKIKASDNLTLTMLHFFIDSGIKDAGYYWTEFDKILRLYCTLKKECPTLTKLNIGGGLPFKNSLGFEYDYQYMIDEIVGQIKTVCTEMNVDVPDLYTEFGSFTVAESGAMLYSVVGQKQQNDKELWYMIDGSLITTLPDIWGMNQRYIVLPVNNWDKPYRSINIGGLTCDISDYYNAEAHLSRLHLPLIQTDEPQYIGFFNTGAYQEALSGYGGLKHCLLPAPKHVLVDDRGGTVQTKVFAEAQPSDQMMRILGY